jgi:UDP-galactose transporter B1
LGSSFGYYSLNYINYPLLLLAKSSKLVPVMLLSYVINGKRYSMGEVLSVVLISLGVALFSCKVHPSAVFGSSDGTSIISSEEEPLEDGSLSELAKTLIGLALVLVNLLLDGFTNARQDQFKKQHPKTGSWQMMYQMNIWRVITLT